MLINAADITALDTLFYENYPIQVGPFFRSLKSINVEGQQAAAKLVLAEPARAYKDQFLLHPSIMDSLLGCVVYLGEKLTGQQGPSQAQLFTFVPIYIDQIKIAKPLIDDLYYVHVHITELDESFIRSDVLLIDDSDQIILQLNGLEEKRIKQQDLEKVLETKVETQQNLPDRENITRTLTTILSEILFVDSEQLEPSKNFISMGLDSILGMEFVKAVNQQYDIKLTGTTVYENPTLNKLRDHIVKTYGEEVEQRNPATSLVQTRISNAATEPMTENARPLMPSLPETIETINTTNSKDIAIIGIACKFPASHNAEALWHHLEQGDYLITDIPQDRREKITGWDKEEIYCAKGSFIDDVEHFDAGFFNISPLEAELMDPQLRLLLEVSWEAIEDGGYGGQIRGSKTGFYLGNCFNDYSLLLKEQMKTDSHYAGLGNSNSSLSNRVSYALDLKGPSLTLDTACSSSLVALDLACKSLRQKETDIALVGGVNLSLHPQKYDLFCKMEAFSKSGLLNPFDEQADGYIPGEAIAVVLVKRLSDAIRDNDSIHGVVKGIAIKHGGYTGGPTVPNYEVEKAVMLEAWRDGDISGESLSYYEAHGTGTKLGDPLEINALKAAFSDQTHKKDFCAIGTVKANIGHSEATAGLAGVIKVLLMFRHKKIPCLPKFKQLNSMLELGNTPFYINKNLQNWTPKNADLRRAGISSFGMGGTLAHVVLQEYEYRLSVNSGQLSVNEPVLIVLSAKNEDRLKEYREKFHSYLTVNREPETVNLRNLAYTLQVGREAMETRVVFIVKTAEELIEKLEEFTGGKTPIENCYQGQVKKDKESANFLANDDDSKEMIQKWISKRKIKQISPALGHRLRNRLGHVVWRCQTETHQFADLSVCQRALLDQ